MVKYIPTKKTNPCPACGDTKGKCRTFSDSPVILCMESSGGQQVTGFINTGDTKDGLWGKLIPEDDYQERGKSWQEQQEELARRKEEERRIEQEKLKHALPVDERSPEFRKLLLQLELTPEDNQNLLDRGLSPDDIKRLLIKSVEPKQTVEGIKPNLPGLYNNQISVAGGGYLCPAYDEYGRIVGCQLRIRDAEDNKYRWLKGKFPSHLLVEGHKELPITVLKGSGEDIYLTEGILKPAVANAVHGKTFIGASGGNFTSSPKQLKRILKNTVGKDGVVYFCPDAGFNLNPQVQRRDRATIELVQSLGYEIKILDWGQLNDKHSVGDVDEITPEDLESAIVIPAQETEADDLEIWEETLNHWVEPDDDDYNTYQQRIEWEEDHQWEAEKEREKEQWRDNFPTASKNSYNRLKKFTPSQRINKQFLSVEDIPHHENSIIAIRSPMGTGKTQVIDDILKEIERRYPEEGALALGHRNNLLIQSGERWGFIHLKTAEVEGKNVQALISDTTSKILACFDSLIKFNPKDFDGRNLILDETTAGILHLLTSKTEVSRRLEATCELLEEALQRCKRIFCLDGLLTDSAIEYISKLAGNKSVYKIQNNYKNPVKITHFVGTEEQIEGELILKKNKRGPLFEMMTTAERPVVVSDSQLLIAAVNDILKAQGKQGLMITSETSAEDYVKDFLKSPDDYIRQHQPDYLLYNSSMESGNDISIRGYFDQGYYFYFGVIGTDAQHQITFRVRDENLERFVWCREFNATTEQLRSPFPRSNLKNHRALLLKDIENCFEKGEDVTEKLQALCEMSKENPHEKMWSELEAIHNYEQGNLRECLMDSLKDAGHVITELSLEDCKSSIEADAKDEVKTRYSEDIYNAEDIDASEIEERKRKGKWKDQCAVSKKILKLQLPEIEKTPHWTPETIRLLKYEDRDHIRKLERWWMFNNLDDAKILQRRRWEKLAEGTIHKFHLRSDYSKILALIDAGITPFLEDTDREWKEDDPEVVDFIANCKKYEFKLAFGRSPSNKTHPMRWIGSCLNFFGCNWKEKQKRINGERVRFYHVVPALKTDMRNETFYNCIVNRFQKMLEKLKSEKSPEAQAPQGVEGVTEAPPVLYKETHSVTATNEENLTEYFNNPSIPVEKRESYFYWIISEGKMDHLISIAPRISDERMSQHFALILNTA